MNNELVSVIIPAYKCAKVISSAIESVLSQTYPNYELIVVDDGSPDNTAEIINRYNDRLRYIYQDNGGVSKARNTGIKHSNGKYIALLDADDTWDETKIEFQMEIFKRHPEINMVFSGFRNTQNGTVLNGRSYYDAFNLFKEYNYDFGEIFKNKNRFEIRNSLVEYYWGDIYDYLFLGNFILPSSVIATKYSLSESGLFNEKLRVAEETEFFLKYSRNNMIGFINKPLVNYEIPCAGNLSGKSNSENLMKNALMIQIDSYISNRNKLNRNDGYYYKGMCTTYSRLAYYYLSEYRKSDARKYARYAIKSCSYKLKPYLIYLMSYAPIKALEGIAKAKRLKKGIVQSSNTSVSL